MFLVYNVSEMGGGEISTFVVISLQSQEQIEEAIRRVDVEKDIEALVENTCVTADDDKAEFLIVDYFVRNFTPNMHIIHVQNFVRNNYMLEYQGCNCEQSWT